LNPRERIGFAELSAKWRIGSPLLAAKIFNFKVQSERFFV
jgi:hypothetical protein